MEDILEVYARPYNVDFPVVCMDESSVQLIGEVHEPIPVAPGHPVLMDDEYVRKGVASIFMASLYTAFPPEEARRLSERLEIHYTPKHGSWLDIAEIELSVLKRQCLAGRIDCIEKMRSEVAAWNTDRNNRQTKVDWQFTTNDARIKLKRLYPKL